MKHELSLNQKRELPRSVQLNSQIAILQWGLPVTGGLALTWNRMVGGVGWNLF